MFSRFFIERPIFASVISIVILIAGLVTLGAQARRAGWDVEIYDAMTSCRLQTPLPSERALDRLSESKGETVDSDCVEALVDRLRKVPKTIPLAPMPY